MSINPYQLSNTYDYQQNLINHLSQQLSNVTITNNFKYNYLSTNNTNNEEYDGDTDEGDNSDIDEDVDMK
jgi:hypothetical protein